MALAPAPRYAIHESDITAVKAQLDRIWACPPDEAPFEDANDDVSWGPVVVKDGLSIDQFTEWLNVNEGRLRRWSFEPNADGSGDGRVLVYSLPSMLHADTAGAISMSIIKQIVRLGGDLDLMDTIRLRFDPTCRMGDRVQEPDSSFTPTGSTVGSGGAILAANGCPFPTFIVETAYKNERLGDLERKLQRWMDPALTSVQVAIGIKIFAGGSTPLRRVAILHVRGMPTQFVEFGMDQPRVPPLLLTFPLAALYVGVPMPPALAGLVNPQISIDLSALRDSIEALIQLDVAA